MSKEFREAKAKQDRKNLKEFISSIQNNKEAFGMFYEMAQKSKLTEVSPQRKF